MRAASDAARIACENCVRLKTNPPKANVFSQRGGGKKLRQRPSPLRLSGVDLVVGTTLMQQLLLLVAMIAIVIVVVTLPENGAAPTATETTGCAQNIILPPTPTPSLNKPTLGYVPIALGTTLDGEAKHVAWVYVSMAKELKLQLR